MDYYRPELANRQSVPMPYIFVGFKLNFLWPLQQHASRLQHVINNVFIMLTLLCYVLTNFAHFMYISEHINNISAVSECLTTLLMGVQFFIRSALLAIRQREMRQLFQRFYKKIYFTSDDDAKLHGRICSFMRIITVLTAIYWIPMLLEFLMFPLAVAAEGGMSSNTKPYFYRMSFTWYDAQDPLNFIITSFYSGWFELSCSTLMAADDYFLCMILVHTSYRYKELQQKLLAILLESQSDAQSNERDMGSAYEVFRQRLYNIFRRQQELDSFVKEAKLFFTYQIFLCLSFGVVALCVVCFHLQTVPFGLGWVMYIVWINSQSAQFIMIGFFGQMLMNEYYSLGDSYYMCEWELISTQGNTQSNKSLMNDIKFAIMRAQRGAVFDGLKMCHLTHSTVGYALRSAISYFMFLNTINEANK